MPKGAWPSVNRYKVFFVQTSRLPPSIHQKLNQYGRCCVEINKLPTNGLVESKVGTFNSLQFLLLRRKLLRFEEYLIIDFLNCEMCAARWRVLFGIFSQCSVLNHVSVFNVMLWLTAHPQLLVAPFPLHSIISLIIQSGWLGLKIQLCNHV